LEAAVDYKFFLCHILIFLFSENSIYIGLQYIYRYL
jgi:hypothetical protein